MKVVTRQEFQNENIERNDSTATDLEFDRKVLSIIDDVRANGDQALMDYTERFDGVRLQEIIVSKAEFEEAMNNVSASFLAALKEAKKRIGSFHELQRDKSWFIHEDNGIMLGQKVSPLDKVGIYVPGGKAAYPSTVLMNALPAKIAGVPFIAMTTPPQSDGKVSPYVLAAAKEAGVDVVYKVGGAQAIAALAYGTETIEKVVKITGPGNAFVARAKKWVFGDVAIDMIAGPSEICILADDTANPVYAAADLLSQAEHDERAAAICVTTSKRFAVRLADEVDAQLQKMDRFEIASQSIADYGRIIVVDSLQDGFDVINEMAPEHLQLMIKDPNEQLPYIKHAGAIFLGQYSPEALGDYMAGPNHTLPTSGTAAFSSPLGVYDFMKKSSIIQFSKEAFMEAADHVITLATAEQLTGHANSIQVRKGDSIEN